MASEDSNTNTTTPVEPRSKPEDSRTNTAPPVEPSSKPAGHEQPTPTELLSSAKVVANAATSAFSNQADKLDKGAVAGAAADLLGAASHYGNLQEGNFGKYVSQAETYLEKYSESGDSAGRPQAAEAAEEKKAADASGGEADSGGGGLGGYMKMAQGFLK